jgi:transcriptional regulator with XRE-family HTH domain
MAIGCQLVTVSAAVTGWQHAWAVRDWTQTTLAERFTYALELRDKSLGDLARATGKPKATFSRIKSGDRPQGEPETQRLIAEHLRVSLEWLSGGQGEPDLDAPVDPEGLPNGLRELVDSAPGEYTAKELRQAAMYRDLFGRDLPPETWRLYLAELRRAAKLVALELPAGAKGPRVVHDDPIEARKAARRGKR